MEKQSNVKNEVSRDPLPCSPPSHSNTAMSTMISNTHIDTDMPSCSNERNVTNGSPAKDGRSSTEEDPVDIMSVRKVFGWETLDCTSIPYLLRKGKKYVSIRIVERKILSKYPNASPDELGKKDPLVSHFITEAEANLLNEINISHCDFEYGDSRFTEKDLVVDLEEFEEFFKVVKKTFPEEILASMNVKQTSVTSPPQPTPTPPTTDPSQCCGWIQINNTVSPYIIRNIDSQQVKLVPLSVIVYAAGLLTNANVEGLNPTAHECKMLNAACKTAGFDFTFGRSTRLIAISEVIQKCQVQIFELPLSNPLQHAHYLDQRITPTMTSTSSNPALRHPPPPPYPCRGIQMTLPLTLDNVGNRPSGFINRFVPRLPGLDPQSAIRAGGMMPLGMKFDHRPVAPEKKLSNLDPSQFPASIQQALLDKCHRMDNAAAMNTMNKMSSNLRPPFWPMMPGQPPPAHSGTAGMVSKTPPSPFDASLPSSSVSTSSYQPFSLPPNPFLHHNPLDVNHPFYRRLNLQSPSGRDNNLQELNNSNQGSQGPLPPQQQPPPPSSQLHHGLNHSLFGNNQFNSSLFARSDSVESKKPGNQPPPSVITSTHHQISHSISKHQNTKPCHKSITTNNQNFDLVKSISACLVNGKSISCLDVETTGRKGKYCLVEAVSKLYFPTVPIQEFVKVLKVVLKANLHPCTAEEETSFVKYYNLPAPRLKCNQMILVEDLTRFFPQLNYVFSKRNANHALTAEANGGLKRPMDLTSGPPMKQATLEHMVQKMEPDGQSPPGENSGNSNGRGTGSVIVIDD